MMQHDSEQGVAFALPTTFSPSVENSLWHMGNLLSFLVTGKETNGRFALLSVTGRKGGEAPLHVHHREEECFYMLEGEIIVLFNNQELRVSAGQFVVLPRNVAHTFRLESEEAKWVSLFIPAGFEEFFVETGEPAQSLALPSEIPMPDIEVFKAAAAKHGIDFL
jgi:quercetin dioxygenase-like cupin family protein